MAYLYNQQEQRIDRLEQNYQTMSKNIIVMAYHMRVPREALDVPQDFIVPKELERNSP